VLFAPKNGAGSASFASLDLILVEINTVLVFPLASSSGFLCIFFVGWVNVAMVDFAKISLCFVFVP
jgi:hypothetical protein